MRATISFPSEIYQTLEDIARQKKVSLAWVVREASEQYIADKWPLLAPRKGALRLCRGHAHPRGTFAENGARAI